MESEPNCKQLRLQLCGENYDFIVQYQANHKKKHKCHLSIERAINQLITKVRESQTA